MSVQGSYLNVLLFSVLRQLSAVVLQWLGVNTSIFCSNVLAVSFSVVGLCLCAVLSKCDSSAVSHSSGALLTVNYSTVLVVKLLCSPPVPC